MTQNFTRLTIALAFGVLLTVGAACGGGPETRQERAQDQAENQSAVADQNAEDADETEEVLDDHSLEAIGDADDIADETP